MSSYGGSIEMARRAQRKLNLRGLTKGELRKLNALTKSLGQEIAHRAFGEWLATRPERTNDSGDKYARIISAALEPLVKKGRLRVPRGGYVVRRGRGRVIVERLRAETRK
jgi:hypothetical protein